MIVGKKIKHNNKNIKIETSFKFLAIIKSFKKLFEKILTRNQFLRIQYEKDWTFDFFAVNRSRKVLIDYDQ